MRSQTVMQGSCTSSEKLLKVRDFSW